MEIKPLFGQVIDLDAKVLQKESIQHREICLMKLSGMTGKEIAAKLEIDPVTVSYTLNEPWAKQFMLEMLHSKGEKAIEELLQTYAKSAVETLHTLSKDAKSEAVRANSAFALVKAGVGTKIQVTDAPKSLDAIEKEESKLTSQLDLLTGRN